MKKLVLLIAVLLITVTSVDAQRRHHHNRRGYDRSERIDRRADNLTESMVKTYGLNDKQKNDLFELNKKWIDHDYYGRGNKGRNSGYCGEGNHRRGNDYCGDYDRRDRDSDNNRYATPTLYPELRLQYMTKRVAEYKAGLKKIMTSSQFKAYEKRVANEIEYILKKD